MKVKLIYFVFLLVLLKFVSCLMKTNVTFPSKLLTREERIELIKKHSLYYHEYQKLKEKFGTDFKPLFDDFGFLDDPDTEMH